MNTNQSHLMLDLETLSSSPRAAIIQIGAVVFTEDEIGGPGFKATIKLESAMCHGEVSASTLRWWMQQSDAARKSVISGQDSLTVALVNLAAFIQQLPQETLFWSHATFDFPVLISGHLALDLPYPIPHKQQRDLRTLEMFYGGSIEWDDRGGVHHDALDDAKYQALHAQRMLRARRKQIAKGTGF